MAVVLITSEYFGKFSDEGRALLIEAGFKVIDNPYGHKFLSEEEIIAHIGEAEAIICDLEKITKRVLDAAPNLKIIARRGVGIDSINLDEAAKRGIEVRRTTGVIEKSVAELVMAYILNHSRKIREMDAQLKKNKWNRILGSSLEGKILGIVGLGNIAAEVIKRAKAFDMEVVYFSASRSLQKEKAMGVDYLPLEELLARTDFVSLHIPLNSQTEKMFDYETLCRMKPEGFLINTARGPIVDELGLCRILKEGKIAGAAVDVFDVEPKPHSPLTQIENTILTPHIGTFTRETYIKMDIMAAQNIISFFRNGTIQGN